MTSALFTLKASTTLAMRMYGSRPGRKFKKLPNPGVQRRLEIMKEDEPEKDSQSETMEEDMIDVESDFMQAHKSHRMHKEELAAAREKTKLRIIGRKYFKEFEPSLLTFSEKEQMRYLHENDPMEWTPEKLSESFPALPHTVQKILKSKWTPKNVERVLMHDQQVVENWEKYKKGELPLEPRLGMHLKKFKDRKVTLSNTAEIAKKIMPQQFSFKKPRSTLFANVIQGYIDKKNAENVITDTTTTNKSISAGENDSDANEKNMRDTIVRDAQRISQFRPGYDSFVIDKENSTKKSSYKNNPVTFDKFMKDTMDNMKDVPSDQDKVLMDVYRRRTESKAADDEKKLMGKELEITRNETQSEIVLEESQRTEIRMDSVDKGLETYVKEWKDKTGAGPNDDEPNDDYPEYIDIPRNKFRRGKIYRVADRYYDDDGEFLYRVPGLKN